MTPKDFVEIIRSLVDENQEIYKRILMSTPADDIHDPYWIGVRKMFDEADADQKEILLSIMRQVSNDAISTILGLLDGGVAPEGVTGEFELKYVENGENVLNKYIQDIFLEVTEQNQ